MTSSLFLKAALIVGLLTSFTRALEVQPIPLQERKEILPLPGMCSTAPASAWDTGLVTGNGIMGAIIEGHPFEEIVTFNHERLFRPIYDQRPLPPRIANGLPEVRRLMKSGKSEEAQAYWREVMAENGHTKMIRTPSYHPAYRLKIQRPHGEKVSHYLRSVDFSTGEVTVRFHDDKGPWISKTFVSRADNVVVQLLETPDQRPFDLSLNLLHATSHLGELKTHEQQDHPFLQYRFKYRKTKRGYEGTTLVLTDQGTSEINADTLSCKKIRRVLLLTRITDLDEFSNSQLPETRKELLALPPSYELLLKNHQALHQPAMERMTVHLDHSDARYHSSEELIAQQSQTRKIIPAFLEKMVNMGRYTLLSSSGRYPPCLTGIWNGSSTPAWSGDFTLNTNLNQQISGANICALPEALTSYLSLIEEIAPTWEVNAKNLYGIRGNLAGTRTAGRENYQTHFLKFPGHLWTSGASWLTYPLYEYYQTTGDLEFLKKHVLPLMEKNVLFYENFLTEFDDQGHFLFIPSNSPENNKTQTINASQDIAAAKQAIKLLIQTYRDLNIKPERISQLESMQSKFPPYLIDPDGSFKEWAYPGFKESYNHRHMSHSYPVWPAHELNWEQHPQLMKAMRVATEKRLPQNWSAHGFVIRAFSAARTKYPELFWQNLYTLMRYQFIARNLIMRHDPDWGPNTDALCALPALVSEALVYSKPGEIELLPAWSSEIPRGSAKGIPCRTQATVSHLEWDLLKKKITATFTSRKDQWITLTARQGIQSIQSNQAVKTHPHAEISRSIFLSKDTPTQIELTLQKATNSYPVNQAAFTLDLADASIEELIKTRKEKKARRRKKQRPKKRKKQKKSE